MEHHTMVVLLAQKIRSGEISMPDITKMDKDEVFFLWSLVADDALFDFWWSVKDFNIQYIKALCDYANMQDEYEAARKVFAEVESKMLKAQKVLQSARESGMASVSNTEKKI